LVKEPEPRNRMREIFKSGSVGGAPGNRCFYLEAENFLHLSIYSNITEKNLY